MRNVDWQAAVEEVRSLVTGVLTQAGVNPAPFVDSKRAGHWAGRIVGAALAAENPMPLPGYDVCPRCSGEGWLQGRCHSDHDAPDETCTSPCLVCSGVGSVPADATIQAVADRLISMVAEPVRVARAALVAYAQSVKENP